MVIKFYDLPLNHLNKKLTDFNLTEAQFHILCHGNNYLGDFHPVYRI